MEQKSARVFGVALQAVVSGKVTISALIGEK